MKDSKKRKPIYVRLSRFESDEDTLSIGISGAVFEKVLRTAKDVAFNNRVYLVFRAIEVTDGVDSLELSPRKIVIIKDDGTNWDEIIPDVEIVLGLLFGERLRVSKHKRRSMPPTIYAF